MSKLANELKNLDFQDEATCIKYVKRSGTALKYVREQTPAICLAAVTKCGNALKFVIDQTPELCLIAVKNNGSAIKHVKDQTHEICLAAIKRTPYSIEYVHNQTEDLCMAALDIDPFTISRIRKPTDDMYKKAIDADSRTLLYLRNLPENIQYYAVEKDPHNIRYFDPTESVIVEAILNDAMVLIHVENRTIDLCKLAMQKNARVIGELSDVMIYECFQAFHVENDYETIFRCAQYLFLYDSDLYITCMRHISEIYQNSFLIEICYNLFKRHMTKSDRKRIKRLF